MLKTDRMRALALCVLVQFSTVARAEEVSVYDGWIQRLQELPPQTGDYAALVPALNVLNAINASINTSDDIRNVRQWGRDDALVDALIPFAAGAFAETRIPATLILGNVVDNTNVCRVMAFIEADRAVTPDGRYNLLQVVRQVSYYAFDDTGDWIAQFVGRWRTKFSGNPDLNKTQALLTQIQDVLSQRTVGRGDTLNWVAADKFKACQPLLQASVEAHQSSDDVASVDLPAQLDVATIREGLFGPARQGFANALVARYGSLSEAERPALLSLLLDAIINQGDDGARRYRVNLYIAVTFSRMPEKTLDAAELERLAVLSQSAEMNDPTFSQNVARAIKRQGG